jgi:hypothetical protein
LTAAILGGGTLTNLANSGTDYQEFDVSTPEIASAAWLNKAAPLNELVYADRYGALRLETVMGNRNALLGDITPLTLDRNAWVYASRTNIVDDITRSVDGN